MAFFQVSRIIAAPTVASWFETREDALLTMRVRDLILRSIAKRCVSKDDAIETEMALKPGFDSIEKEKNLEFPVQPA
jgi:hypothetical protein